MSTLSSNLERIYLVKNQLKEVLGTTSDIFEEYPQIASELIAGGGGVTPTGTLFVMNPGQYDIASYAYVAVCKDYTEDYGGLITETTVGSYVGMNHAQTSDNSESIGTLTSAIATEFGTAFGVNLTPYVGSNYVMFSDFFDSQENGYGIFIDTNAAFTAAGYPTQTPSGDPLDFYMVGQLAWKNDSASVGDVSSLVIGEASNVGGNF